MNRELKRILEHHGAVCRRQYPKLCGSIDRAVRNGELLPLMTGTYSTAVTFHTLVASISMWDPLAVFSGGTAARLTWWPEHRSDGDTVHANTHRCPKRPLSGTKLRQRKVSEELVRVVAGIRVSHPALSVLELAVSEGAAVIDEALRRRATTVTSLNWALRLTSGREGNPQLAALLRASRDSPWSALERQAHELLRRARITGWKANYPVQLPRGTVYLDAAFPGIQVALEFDGWQFHGNHQSFVADRQRDVALRLAGWTVLRFTADSLDALVPTTRKFISRRRYYPY